MIFSIKTKKSTLVMLCLFVVYLVAVANDVRGGKLSGDEKAYLSGFEDRGAAGELDHRYILWVYYIVNTAHVNTALPLIINILVLIGLVKLCVSWHIFPLWAAAGLCLLPSVFYFINGYLRDIVFLLFSLLLILFSGRRHSSFLWRAMVGVAWISVLSMRPVYGLFFLAIYVLSSARYVKYYRATTILIATVFVIMPTAIYFDYDMYNLYWEFFESGNLRGKSEVGVMMIPVGEFDQVNSALNSLLSPLYFWYVPPKGFGRLYDILLLFENIVLAILTAIGVVRFRSGKIRSNRLYRMSLLALLLSCFMAAVATVHLDVYRFRLIFIPFVYYFAFSGLAIVLSDKIPRPPCLESKDKNCIHRIAWC